MNEFIFVDNIDSGKDFLDWLNFFVQLGVLICAGFALFSWKNKTKYDLAIHTIYLIEKLKFNLKGDIIYSLDVEKDKNKVLENFNKLYNFKLDEYEKVIIRVKSVFRNDKNLIKLLKEVDDDIEIVADTFGFLVFGVEFDENRLLLNKNKKDKYLEKLEEDVKKTKEVLENKYINKGILKSIFNIL